MSLSELPVVCLSLKASYLSVKELPYLARVNKRIAHVFRSEDQFWHELCRLCVRDGDTTQLADKYKEREDRWRYIFTTLISRTVLIGISDKTHNGAVLSLVEYHNGILSGALDREIRTWYIHKNDRMAGIYLQPYAHNAEIDEIDIDKKIQSETETKEDEPENDDESVREASSNRNYESYPYVLRERDVWLRTVNHGVVCMAVWREYIWIGTSDGKVLGYTNTSDTEATFTLPHQDGGWVLSLSRYNEYLVSGGEMGVVKLWDLRPFGFLASLKRGNLTSKLQPVEVIALHGHTKGVLCITQWNDMLCTSSSDTTIRIWDNNYKCKYELKKHTKWVQSVIVWGEYLVSAAEDAFVYMWDKTGSCILSIYNRSAVRCLALYQDKLYVGCLDGKIRVWDNHGTCLQVLREHASSIWCMLPITDILLSAGDDRTICIWGKKGMVL